MDRSVAKLLTLPVLALLLCGGPAVGDSGVAEAQGPSGRAERAARLRAMGRAHLTAGDAGSAAGYFREAIEADRRDAESYVLLGRIYLERGTIDDAIAVFSAGLRRRPDHGPLYRAMAEGLERAGDLDGAASALRELCARSPGDVDGHLARAELARRRRAHAEAQASYRAIVDLAARGARVPAETLDAARRYIAALAVHLGEVDPVAAADRCESQSEVRRALSCR